MKSYPAMWGLFHKPIIKYEDSYETTSIYFMARLEIWMQNYLSNEETPGRIWIIDKIIGIWFEQVVQINQPCYNF